MTKNGPERLGRQIVPPLRLYAPADFRAMIPQVLEGMNTPSSRRKGSMSARKSRRISGSLRWPSFPASRTISPEGPTSIW
jgi:hypothetical protein